MATIKEYLVALGSVRPLHRQSLRTVLRADDISLDTELDDVDSAIDYLESLEAGEDVELEEVTDLLASLKVEVESYLHPDVWSQGSLDMLMGQAQGWERAKDHIISMAVEAFREGDDTSATLLRDVIAPSLEEEAKKVDDLWRQENTKLQNHHQEIERRASLEYDYGVDDDPLPQ